MTAPARRAGWIVVIIALLVALAWLVMNILIPPVITVEWSTASELNTAGFNVYRGRDPAGPFTPLNTELIPASPDPLIGGAYTFTDTQVVSGQTYYYQLEEVETNGGRRSQGVVAATASGSLTPLLLVGGGLLGLGIVLALWSRRSRRRAV